MDDRLGTSDSRGPEEWSEIARCVAVQNPVDQNGRFELDTLRDQRYQGIGDVVVAS
jgi:hypothetical protein